MVTVMSIGSAAILQMSGAYIFNTQNLDSRGFVSGGYLMAANGYTGVVSTISGAITVSGGIILSFA